MERVRVNQSMEIKGSQTPKEWIMLESKLTLSQQLLTMAVTDSMDILKGMINLRTRTLHL